MSKEIPIDEVMFEWATILGMGDSAAGVAQGEGSEFFEVLEEGLVRDVFPKENVANWPQEPTAAKLTGLRGTKAVLENLFNGVILPVNF